MSMTLTEIGFARLRGRRPASGNKRTELSLTRIVVGFDGDTFTEIQERAAKQKTSFGDQVRQLVEWGLMTDEGMQR